MKNKLYKTIAFRKTSDGFTLVELMIAMSITTIVIGITGWGVVAIAQKNQTEKAETERRVELNRAQDFISDEVRTAIQVNDNNTSSLVPDWAKDNDKADPSSSSLDWINNLGGGSPSAKLYLQIPLKVDNIDAANDKLTIQKHGFSAGNAVMFTGSGVAGAGLSKNTVYYVTKDPDTGAFQVSTSINNAKNGTALDLNAVSPGSLTANRLLIYYNRDNTDTWLGPNTINRSAGPCSSPYQKTNCPVLVDSIAEEGFTANAISSRKADLSLIGQLFDDSSKTLQVSNNAFARLSEVGGGANKAADAADKAAKEAKEAADKAAKEAKEAADKAAKEAKAAAEKAAAEKAAAEKAAVEKAAAEKAAAEKAAVEKAAAEKAAVEKAAAEKAAVEKAAVEKAAAEKAAKEAEDGKRFTNTNGTLNFTQASNLSIQVLGGEITCGPGGAVVPTTTTINVTPAKGKMTSTTLPSSNQSLNLNVSAGTTLTVTGSALKSSGCSGFAGTSFNSSTNNGSQVLTRRNGASVPYFPAFAGQGTIDSYLTKYLDPVTKKVKIANNQAIFLFELGTTTKTIPAYDLQDLVVLATVQAN